MSTSPYVPIEQYSAMCDVDNNGKIKQGTGWFGQSRTDSYLV